MADSSSNWHTISGSGDHSAGRRTSTSRHSADMVHGSLEDAYEIESTRTGCATAGVIYWSCGIVGSDMHGNSHY